MSTAIEVSKQFALDLSSRSDNIAALLEGTGYDPQRFITQALQVVGSNPSLLECTRESLLLSVLEAAEIGLDLSPALGQCCIVPRRDKKTGKKTAKFQPMARGIISLFIGGGGALSITAEVVYEGDHYIFDRGQMTLSHVRGDGPFKDEYIVAAYARAVLPSGAVIFEEVTRAMIDRAREKAQTDFMWQDNFREMSRKTAVHRIKKYIPIVDASKAQRISRAVEIENQDYDFETPSAPMRRAPRMPQSKKQYVEVIPTSQEIANGSAVVTDEHPGAIYGGVSDGTQGDQGDEYAATDAAVDALTVVGIADPETGEKNGKKWTRFRIEFSDGRNLSTFSRSIYESAISAHTNGNAVEIQTEVKGQYENLVSLQVIA